MHDTTVIPPYCLLLFAGKIAIQHLEGTLSVDDWLFFSAPARVGVLIQKLREYVDHVLYAKFANPQSSFVADPLLDRICSLLITNGLYHCLFHYLLVCITIPSSLFQFQKYSLFSVVALLHYYRIIAFLRIEHLNNEF